MSDDLRPYSGVRILDTTHDLGRYATRLFADLGAEVIRIEPSGGLPDRQRMANAGIAGEAEFSFMNASKRSLVLDPASNAGRQQLAELARSSQLIVLERGGSLGPAEIDFFREMSPTSVIVWVSPYGLQGPLSDAPASDLTLQAAGGIAWMSGRGGEPPLRLPGGQAAMIASVYTAAAAAACLWDAEERGRGHLIDLSAQECIAHSLQNAIQVWDLEKRVSHRAGEGTRDASENIYACKDGYVFLASPPTTGVSWKSLIGWMQEVRHPSAAAFSEEKWLDRKWRYRPDARAEFKPIFEAFTREFTRAELTENALKRRIVMAPVSQVHEVLGDQQLNWRDYFIRVEPDGPRFPGAPYKLSEPVWAVRPAPSLNEYARSA